MDFTIAFDIPISTVSKFLMVFSRIAGLIFFAPIFGNQAVSYPLKLGLILVLSILIFPIIGENNFDPMVRPIDYVSSILQELIIGVVIGFAVRLIFTGIHLAGSVAARQMGFGIAMVLSPQAGVQIPIVAQIYGLMASLIFLTINAHYLLLGAIAKSFELIPLAGFQYSPKITASIVTLSENIFITAIRLSAPIVCTLFLVNLALGLIARAVPEVNVFILGFPLKILLGLLILSVSIRIFSNEVVKLFHQISYDLGTLINFMVP